MENKTTITNNVRTITRWNMVDVRNMCVKYDYYTNGTNEDYSNMLAYVNTHNPSTDNILLVAINIVDNSDLDKYEQTHKENVEDVMNTLYNECVRTVFSIM